VWKDGPQKLERLKFGKIRIGLFQIGQFSRFAKPRYALFTAPQIPFDEFKRVFRPGMGWRDSCWF
jgi:hypothetical protein